MQRVTSLVFAICIYLIPAIALADSAAGTQPSTVVGVLQLTQLKSVALHTTRTLRVWLPPGYTPHPITPYAVLYMHDGQNLFDKATSAYGHEWEIDETLTKLITSKTIPPLIIVGIDNGQGERLSEYTYAAAPPKYGGGHGAIYAKFLLEEVKPFIEKTYPVGTDTAHNYLGGSSLGGLVSLEIARRNPHVFGGVIAMSPSLWWPTEPVADDIAHDSSVLVGTRFWIDIGTWEENAASTDIKATDDNRRFVEEATRLSKVLDDHKIENRLLIEKDGHHDEIAWARRFPQAITYLMTGK